MPDQHHEKHLLEIGDSIAVNGLKFIIQSVVAGTAGAAMYLREPDERLSNLVLEYNDETGFSWDRLDGRWRWNGEGRLRGVS